MNLLRGPALCYKYHGLGNDFLLFDKVSPVLNCEYIKKLCHRRFGIGADGLIFLEHQSDGVIRMRFFNSDGKKANFCGNATRVVFAHLGGGYSSIITDAGPIDGFLKKDGIHVKMPKATIIKESQNITEIFCGVMHAFVSVDRIYSDYERVKKLRDELDCNVSFVKKQSQNMYEMLTFEKGVENFTFACGSAAAAFAFYKLNLQVERIMTVSMKGGMLRFYHDIDGALWMVGRATKIGSIEIDENF